MSSPPIRPAPPTIISATVPTRAASAQRARQARPRDFDDFALVLAMDRANYRNLVPLAGDAGRDRLKLFLDFAPELGEDVPDPYYGGADGFERVLDICDAAGRGLLDHLIATHGLTRRGES
jgi:protein-tyrosine phosphatase